MLLKRLVIENLRSYDRQEVVFPSGSTLLSGDIGSGKTTILLAVEFALFGLQPSQKANSLLRNGVDNGRVLLEFEIDGKQVVIERTLKRGRKSISQDYVSLIVDDQKFEESVTEIKSKILNLLNYPSEFSKKTNLLYKFTVYTPQEEMKQIILESKDVRINTLRHVFGVDKYKRIQENSSILTSKLRERARINEALFQGLDEMKENLIEKEKNLIDLKERSIKIIEEHERLLLLRKEKEEGIKETEDKIEDKKSLENEKDKTQIMINEKEKQILDTEKNIESIRNQIKEAEELKFSEEQYNSISERIDFQKNKETELQKDYMDLIGRIKSLESKKVETRSFVDKISGLAKCPTCFQEVLQEYKDNMLVNANKEIDSSDKFIEELGKNKRDLIEKIEVVKKLIEGFVKQKAEMDLLKVKLENIKEKEQRITDIENQKKELNEEIILLRKKISETETKIKEYDKYELIFEERKKELDEIRTKESDAVIKKAELSKEIGFLESQIKENLDKIKEKEKLRDETARIKELEDWISNKFLEIILYTEKQVMITLKHEFSSLFSKWFSILVSDSLTARLDDDFSPLIEQKGYELDYSFLSGGERTAIALAYRLALNQVINSLLSNIKTSDIVILDEPTDGFSAQQLEKMREVLQELNTEQLILVSHEQKMEDFVDNIIKVKKDNGVSGVG